MNRKQIEARIREIWGRRARLDHHPTAPVGAERVLRMDRRKEIAERLRRIEIEIESLYAVDTWAVLARKARFALDVDGDEPSWSELRAATEHAERLLLLIEERRDLKDERDDLALTAHRWELLTTQGLGWSYAARGDELSDIADFLKNRHPAERVEMEGAQ